MKAVFARLTGRPYVTVALVVAATGLVEWLCGRPPICLCGRVRLWTGDVHGPENSQMLADWYSLSHLVHGLLFYGASWLIAGRWPASARLVIATLIEAGWELVENSPVVIERYRAATTAYGYSGDSILNSLSDIGFMILGFALARRLPMLAGIALGIALELVALVAIRDNLTLNILMLVHPVEAVRRWQGG